MRAIFTRLVKKYLLYQKLRSRGCKSNSERVVNRDRKSSTAAIVNVLAITKFHITTQVHNRSSTLQITPNQLQQNTGDGDDRCGTAQQN
ncbi:hypothetical protein PGT21_003625 [Puccinia graminis f. sp. tritici]|uniref:Uncharacterized protein n=1 Tax=Puccinia graminis f. sp. tritici TaxID=56615 RepID=A0A5B0P6X7_PUCGR|nr:hypothetical protein PGT21_003625 [Puccinia graminis f. sp. tritici]